MAQSGDFSEGTAALLFQPEIQSDGRPLVVPATVTAAMATAAVITRQGMFVVRIMGCIAYVPPPVAGFVAAKMVERHRSALRQRSVITIVGVIAVVDMAVKAAPAVEPGTGSNEYAACEPIRSIVAVRSTVVGRVVEVAVRADRRTAHADTDGDLRRHCRCTPKQRDA